MEPTIVPRSDHPISRKLIDPDAVKVLYRLHRAGYQAYLVGGGVRDLLVDRHPKDFDISTDAHPHQVKRLFRNCRLIGRRFRLAHVHFGDKILEVSTFRKRSEPGEGDDTDDILIRSDNTFGTAEEDALRRDFTMNGLFYDISTFSLIDYVGGLPDLTERLVRTIGDPDIRFREDPVRMIRAVKFAARLDFGIEEETYDAILRQRQEILKSARPRLLEEIYRLLGGGAAVESFRLMHETGLLEILIPEVAAFIDAHGGVDGTAEENPLWGWLAVLDRRKAAGIPVANPLLLGALLATMQESRSGSPLSTNEAGGEDEAQEEAAWASPEETLRPLLAELVVPRRDTEKLLQVYRMQRRFTGQRSRRFSPRAFVTKSYFRDAFQFFEIGVEATGRNQEALERWKTLAEQAPAPLHAGVGEPRRRRRRRRRRGGHDEEGGLEMESGQDWSDEPEEIRAAGLEDDEDETFPADERDEPRVAHGEVDDDEDDDEGDEDEDDRADRVAEDAGVEAAPEPQPARGERQRSSRAHEPRTPVAPQGGHATGARAPGGDRRRRGEGPPREAGPQDEQRAPATPPPPPAPRRHDEDDEDSQIRFLGWSDQPAILNPRAHAEEPVPNPYSKERRSGRGGEYRQGGGSGRGGMGRGGPSGGGRDSRGGGQGQRTGSGYAPRGGESGRGGQPGGGRDSRGGQYPRGGGSGRPGAGRPDGGRPGSGRPDSGRAEGGRPDGRRVDNRPMDGGGRGGRPGESGGRGQAGPRGGSESRGGDGAGGFRGRDRGPAGPRTGEGSGFGSTGGGTRPPGSGSARRRGRKRRPRD